MKLLELSNVVKRIATTMPEEEFLQTLKSQARNAYDAIKRQPIYTKVETNEPFFVVDPSRAGRKSKFMIDELAEILPSWRGWTSRLHSVRGWTSKALADARGGGKLCLLIPIDGARVHVSSSGNFYRSFVKAHSRLEVEKIDNDALCAWLKSLHAVAKLAKDDIPAFQEPETAKQLIQALERLDKYRPDVKKLTAAETKEIDRLDLRRAYNAFSGELVGGLSKLLDPDDNGMHTYTSLYNLPGNREVWTGSRCLVIELSEYEAMHKRGAVK